jgi:hypothetical protein
VGKEILATFIGENESIALGVIEPLDSTCRHGLILSEYPGERSGWLFSLLIVICFLAWLFLQRIVLTERKYNNMLIF